MTLSPYHAAEPRLSNALLAAVERNASFRPSASALFDAKGGLSFAGLWAMVGLRAAELRAAGVLEGDIIVARTFRDRAALADMLAIMSVSACYVPVAASATAKAASRCTEACGGRLLEEVLMGATIRAGVAGPPEQIHGSAAAYGIATSGTTGPPKVVMVSIAAFSSQIEALASIYAITEEDRSLHIVSPLFDLSLEVVGTAWCRGASVYMPPDSCMGSPDALQDFCQTHRITIVNGPTALIDAWTRRAKSVGTQLPQSVRLWVVGSEICPPALPKSLLSSCAPMARCINAYGLTETAITSTMWHMDDDDVSAGAVPVGMAVGGAVVRILDDHDSRCEPGQRGNVHIGGDALAIGYARDPVATADRFRPDPWGPPGSRLFDTRDMGFVDHRGRLVIEGRRDRQVKIAGVRVEPEGVARVIESHPEVVAATVAGVPVERPVCLAAWVVTRSDVSVTDLRQFISERAQPHEVPRRWSLIDSFPLTANGKTDLAALLRTRTAVEPMPWEDPIADIVYAAFNGAGIDPTSSFVANGGDSLTALALIGGLRQAGLELLWEALWSETPLAAVLDDVRPLAGSRMPEPAAHGFLSALDADLTRLRALRDLGDTRKDLAFICGPTSLQKEMLAASDGGRAAGDYIEHVSAVVSGIDLDGLVRDWAKVTERHDILRTYVAYDDADRPMLLCRRRHTPEWDIKDWSSCSSADAEAMGLELLETLKRSPLDARAGPPFIWRARRLPNGRVLLIWSYHHALLDGWSDVMLLDELFMLHRGSDVDSLASAGSFRDLVTWISRQDRRASERAWADHLAGIGSDRRWIISDRDGTIDQHASRRASVTLPGACWDAVLRMSRKHGVPPSAIVASTVASAIRRVTGADDVVLGVVSTLRPAELPAITHTAGLLINLVPMRFRHEDPKTPFGTVRTDHGRQTKLLAYGHLTMTEVLQCDPRLGTQPLADTVLVFDLFNRARSVEAASFTAHTRGTVPCTIHVSTRGRFTIDIEHRTGAVSQDRVQKLIREIGRLIPQD